MKSLLTLTIGATGYGVVGVVVVPVVVAVAEVVDVTGAAFVLELELLFSTSELVFSEFVDVGVADGTGEDEVLDFFVGGLPLRLPPPAGLLLLLRFFPLSLSSPAEPSSLELASIIGCLDIGMVRNLDDCLLPCC